MKSFISYERFFSKDTLFLAIYSFNCYSVVQFQGTLPCKISYIIIPTDQISFFIVQILEFSAQGLIQRGDPTLIVSLELAVTLLANPKSAILVILSLINKLAGFKSLCKKPHYPRYLNPQIRSLMMGMAYYQGSLSLFLIRVSKSPQLQNSVMMQQLLAVLQISWHLSILEWLSFLSASISPSNIFFSGLPCMDLMSITLMATVSLFFQLSPLQTTELKPFPIISLRPQEQSSIFFRRSLFEQNYRFILLAFQRI